MFAGVSLDEERVRSQWPEAAVPASITACAQAMDTLHTFTPNLDGPASLRAATCVLPSGDERNPAIVADNDAYAAAELGADPDDAAAATEHGGAARGRQEGDPPASELAVDEAGLPFDAPAEFLIGVQECDSHDPVDRMVAFQKSMELVHEVGRRMHALATQRAGQSAAAHVAAAAADCGPDPTVRVATAAAQLAAQRAAHAAALVDLRTVAQSMGANYQSQLEEALASARMESAVANTPQTLHVKSGKPVNTFAPQAWSAAFVQFFYGDCAPNLDRPCRVPMRNLFQYLVEREELEYGLPTDSTDPLIPGGCYRAPPQSRWNTPELMAVFADTLRKQKILTTTQHMWKGRGGRWAVDIKTICSAKVAHFEKLAAILARHGHQSLAQITHAAAEHKLQPLLKALQYVTFQTANIPLTQGYKVGLRQLGYGLNVYDGPLSIFLTTNFADTYSPITVALMNGAGVPLGARSINLLADCPDMPALRDIHRALAKHPGLQARLFLLLDELVHRELLCTHAFIGTTMYGHGAGCKEPAREDDYATQCQIGIAQLVRSGLKPLEAQGRGFAHGHGKCTSVPRTRAARLKAEFARAAAATEHADHELANFCRAARLALLRAAGTLQYDSAALPGQQVGVQLRPEPFSAQQQRRSRLDGEPEEMDDDGPLRPHLPVTEPEPNGHLRAEAQAAAAEQRPHRDAYKELPLTGCVQSMMPTYRLSRSFGHIRVPDEYGHYSAGDGAATEHADACGLCDVAGEYELDEKGEVVGLRLPTGAAATEEDILADSAAWATSFARDQRSCFIQSHNHNCTATCVKHLKGKRAPQGAQGPARPGQKLSGPDVPKCRFRFYRYVPLKISGATKYVMRRGKELVARMFVATGNDENEYGKAIPERAMPFTSSSSDVLQAALRCNADYQYQKRCVPDLGEGQPSSRAEPATEQPPTFLVHGCRRVAGAVARMILTTLATAMRAANVADFYMTKYQSKAQEKLGPIMQPFVAGMRRIEDEEAEKARSGEQQPARGAALVEMARRRVRRFVFSANRTMWFSPCELAIYIMTGDCAVKTERAANVRSTERFLS